MSNTTVGDIYRQVMDKIVQAVQNDFEEGGYAPEVLSDLRQVWQENLSKLHVAQMPWDPKPAPPTNPAAISNSVKQEPQDATSLANGGSNNVKPEIKYENPAKQTEIKYENAQSYNMNGYAGAGINSVAQQRAANNLVQQFGSQANASIQASGLPQQNRAMNMPVQQRPQMPVPGQGQRPPNYSQTDGAGDPAEDWNAIVSDARSSVNERVEADGMLQRHIQEQWADEDSQIFHTLRKGKAAKSSARQTGVAALPESFAASSSAQAPSQGPAQLDGVEEDEDAINSDLDDTDDEPEEVQDDDDGPLGEMILCTWDKVNRVKNKWKCNLKDGVLATGGKEFLFHKANGEFEW
jgi:transcription initiation factor TFIIA large subunit